LVSISALQLISLQQHLKHIKILFISSKSATSLSDNGKEEESNKDSDTATPIITNLLNHEEYPLLHHHRLNIHDENIHNEVVHELLKACARNSIFFFIS
jgi:hypothetical protein